MTRFVAAWQSRRATPDRGATAVEYGLMIGLIMIAVFAVVTLLGTRISHVLDTVSGTL